jgi:DNA-binding PadR family transcriptional regulator
VARIASMASQSERWVRRCLRSLQKKGLIEVYYRRDGQVQDTNYYTINPDRILMQASVRAKTTLKNGGTQFRGVGNSLPPDGGELTSAKQSTLDRHKEQEKNNKENNTTVRENSQPTCQEEELPTYENPYPDGEVVIDKDGFEILTDSPYDQLDDQSTETQLENISPCQEEPVSSESNNPTHPHPPSCAAPPSPHRR